MNANITNKVRAGITIAAGLALALTMAPGCGGDDEKKAQAPPPACTPGAKECLDPSLARVCPPDGSGWLAQRCSAGARCENGDCIADVATRPCDRHSGSCVDAKSALRCRDNLQGYEAVQCPEGTTCQGAGLCVGACTVGASACTNSTRSLTTCLDGRGFTTTVCGPDEACVVTSIAGAPYATAACKPAECHPTGCTTTCGNKRDPNADQTKSNSSCVSTPDGYEWQVTTCVGYQTCTGGCGSTCGSSCVPGTMRCSADKLGMQTCGADGKWDANVTACNANVTDAALFCMSRTDDPSKVVCGDPVCATGHRGTCEGTSFRACGVDGRLAPAAPCAVGSCVAVASPAVGGVQPATCQVECRQGDERCVGSAFQTCGANGRWGNVTQCPAGADGGIICRGFTNPQGRPAKICNASCTPGTRRCAGAALSTGTAAIQECGANGEWGPAEDCAMGSCRSNFAGTVGAACVPECVPGETVCAGTQTVFPHASIVVRDAFATCSPKGIPGTPTACGAGSYCRKTQSGATIVVGGNACLQCVGGQVAGGNETGLVDRRCVDATADAGAGTHFQTCSDGNVWAGGPLTSCEAVGRTCFSSGATGAVCF